jgi:hypothetical protein
MPYKRKGKCVYKDTGKKMGCSDSASKAKKYIKALYANAGENEELGSFQNYYNKAEENAEKKKKVSKTRAKCQAKAKRKYDVWPSAYASGYVQKCVKRGGNIK